MSSMACQQCGASIELHRAKEGVGTGVCGSCGGLFRLRGHGRSSGGRCPSIPSGIRVDEQPDHVTIIRRWFGAKALVTFTFGVVWNGIMLTVMSMAITTGEPFGFLLFLSVFVLIGLGIIYTAFAYLLNTTTIRVDPNQMRIVHRPLPWPGGGVYDPAQIKQLFAEKKVRQGSNSSRISYQLHAIWLGGKRQAMIVDLDQPEQALFLKCRLEHAMGIRSDAVTGAAR